jgi:hypothetical protein
VSQVVLRVVDGADAEETTVPRPQDPRSGTPDRSERPPSDDDRLVIDCDDCLMQGTGACADCVVTFICSREPGEAVVVDVAEERAIRLLAGAGLLPGLRHVRRSG